MSKDDNPRRIRNDEYWGGGVLNLTDWENLDPHEKLCAKVFEDGIEQGFKSFPPSLDVTPNEDRTDIELTLQLHAGEDNGGPTWQFSMRRAIASYARYGEPEALDELIKTLWRVTKYARMVKERVNGLPDHSYSTHIGKDEHAAEDLWYELDQEFPQQPDRTPAWAKELFGRMVADISKVFADAIRADADDPPPDHAA